MKQIAAMVFVSLMLLHYASPVYAAKKRVKAGGTKLVSVNFSSAKLSRPTNSVSLTLLNLGLVRQVTYTLSYTANGIPQGVVGTVTPTGQVSESRDLYFGTCSKGVCTPHANIKDATLMVATTLKNGIVYRKRYRIKI